MLHCGMNRHAPRAYFLLQCGRAARRKNATSLDKPVITPWGHTDSPCTCGEMRAADAARRLERGSDGRKSGARRIEAGTARIGRAAASAASEAIDSRGTPAIARAIR